MWIFFFRAFKCYLKLLNEKFLLGNDVDVTLNNADKENFMIHLKKIIVNFVIFQYTLWELLKQNNTSKVSMEISIIKNYSRSFYYEGNFIK